MNAKTILPEWQPPQGEQDLKEIMAQSLRTNTLHSGGPGHDRREIHTV